MDIKWSFPLVSLAVFLYVGTTLTEGCMCERWHPQQHFCASTYVIGGHVLKREFVRVETEISPAFMGIPPAQLAPSLSLGEIEPPPEGLRPFNPGGGLHPLPDEPRGQEGLQNLEFPEAEPIYHPRGLQPLPNPEGLRPLEGLQEAQRHPEDVGSPPLSQDLEALPYPDELHPLPQEGLAEPFEDPEEFKPLPHPEGLEPLPDESKPEPLPPLPLPEELTTSQDGQATSNDTTSEVTTLAPKEPKDKTTETTTTSAVKTPVNSTTAGTTPEGQHETTTAARDPHFDPSNVDPWNYKIVYTIKLAHIYKTGKEEAAWNIGDEVQLSTPAAESQCGQTTLRTERTYLISGRRSGRLSFCDWIQEHHRLTTRQKQGLKTVYGKSCDTCHIKACPSARHCSKPKHNRATTCLYDASQVRPGHPYSLFDCPASHSRCTLRHGKRCKWQKNNDYHDCTKYHDQLP